MYAPTIKSDTLDNTLAFGSCPPIMGGERGREERAMCGITMPRNR